jgi:hypothetical protein
MILILVVFVVPVDPDLSSDLATAKEAGMNIGIRAAASYGTQDCGEITGCHTLRGYGKYVSRGDSAFHGRWCSRAGWFTASTT